jgi:hypothetical protein
MESLSIDQNTPKSEHGANRITCLNCATVFSGNFCPSCGQKYGPAMPTTTEIVGDLMRSALSPSGKMFESLKTLMLKPGELTRVYLAGQRMRYVHPVRMYLLAVFVFAAVVGINNTWRDWTGQKSFEVVATRSLDFSRGNSAEETPETAKPATDGTAKKTGEKVGRAMKESFPPWLLDIVKARAARMGEATPEQLQAKVMRASTNSYSLIFALLVPFMAAINWLLYLGRGVNYAGHFVFMLHGTAASALIFLLPYAINQPLLYFPTLLISSIWYLLAGRRAFGVTIFGSLWRYILSMIPGVLLSGAISIAIMLYVTLFS